MIKPKKKKKNNTQIVKPIKQKKSFVRLTVRLGEARAGRVTTPLLGFGAAGIGDEEGAVISEVLALDVELFDFVGELLEVSDEALSDGLADGVGLGDLTTPTDGDVDLKAGELLGADEGDGFHNLS